MTDGSGCHGQLVSGPLETAQARSADNGGRRRMQSLTDEKKSSYS
ncbi:hypothetical protein RAN3_3076 [plant metagenome]|uniref:Uncharacterized protein n=1 Tax=plant metagenome TaxID=1297885 RepID=A0A484UPR6_9ZZZZ